MPGVSIFHPTITIVSGLLTKSVMECSRAVGRASRKSGGRLLFQGAALIAGGTPSVSGSSGPGNPSDIRRVGGGSSPVSSSSCWGVGRRPTLGDGPSPTLTPADTAAALVRGPVDTSSMTGVGATFGPEVGAATVDPAVACPGGSPPALRGGFRSLAASLRMPLLRVSMR